MKTIILTAAGSAFLVLATAFAEFIPVDAMLMQGAEHDH